jgi:hypothetical protein
MSARIGVSPLTGRIFRGQVSKDGRCFVGKKEDITSDVLKAVIEKADYHGGTFGIDGDGNRWIVTVTKEQDAAVDK